MTGEVARCRPRFSAGLLAAVVLLAGAPAAATVCGGPDPPPVVDRIVRQPPALAEPPARRPFRDPVFGRCLVRITDRGTDIAPGDASRGLKTEYSRVQAFNADERAILIRGLAGTWYLYDAAALRPIRMLAFDGPVDPRWDPADPNLLHFIRGTELFAYDVRGDEPRLVRDFATDFPGQKLAAVWSRYEGSPSFDGRYWGLMAEDETWQPVAFLVYDRTTDTIVSRRSLHDAGDVDHVGMSPRGDHLVAAFDRYCEKGRLGSDARPCGLMVYDRGLGPGRGLARIIGHYDLAVDAAGRDVIVYQDIDTDHIAMMVLATGERTALHPIDFSKGTIGLHFSGRASRRPGWALVSTYGERTESQTWMDDQVFAVELKPGGRVVRLAHTRSRVDPKQEHDYWAEPHGTVNRDFTRVLFTTNWGRSGTEKVDVMLIDLSADWPDRLP
jgi:hypothetical protein